MSSKVRQYPFHELETLSRSDAALYNRALAFAAGANTMDLAQDVSKRLSEALGRTSLHFDFAGVVHHTTPAATDMTAWRAFLHYPGGAERALVVLDSTLADDWLRWALEDDEVRLGAPLAPRDWGALSYAGLEVLQALAKRGATPLMLDTTPPIEEAVERYFSRHRTLHEFCWIVSDRRTAGWLRVWAPARWLDTYLEGSEASPHALDQAIARLSGITTRFDVIMASRKHVALSDVRALSRGDIVFPESHCLTGLDELSTPASEGFMRRGSCSFVGRLKGEVAWKFELSQSEPIPIDRDENDMSEKSVEVAEELSSSSEKTESINISALHKAHVDVDIRVGCVELSVAELARIQAGQILELDRKVGDLVDILVDGQLHGRGELVNVEGAIGVRVTSLER